MNYYTCAPQENGDILLKYNIIDIANYNIIKQDDGNVLLQKKQQEIYLVYFCILIAIYNNICKTIKAMMIQ